MFEPETLLTISSRGRGRAAQARLGAVPVEAEGPDDIERARRGGAADVGHGHARGRRGGGGHGTHGTAVDGLRLDRGGVSAAHAGMVVLNRRRVAHVTRPRHNRAAAHEVPAHRVVCAGCGHNGARPEATGATCMRDGGLSGVSLCHKLCTGLFVTMHLW